MRIIEIEALFGRGNAHAHNEDALCVGDNMAAVFDGATGLADDLIPHADSDAAWFAGELARVLALAWSLMPHLPSALLATVSRVAERYRAALRCHGVRENPTHFPLSQMAAATAECGRIRLYRIGDCSAFLVTDSGLVPAFAPPLLKALDRKVIDAFSRHLAAGKTPLEARAAVTPLLEEHRALVNRPGGPAVLAPYESCISGLEQVIVPAEPGQRLLLRSDGFAALLNYLPDEEHAGLFEGNGGHVLDRAYARLRALELSDADLLRWPRLKAQDDATAVLIEVIV